MLLEQTYLFPVEQYRSPDRVGDCANPRCSNQALVKYSFCDTCLEALSPKHRQRLQTYYRQDQEWYGDAPRLYLRALKQAQEHLAIERTAEFSDCGRYRYLLGRCWDVDSPTLGVCMLNPSVADHRQDDRTVARCMSFAQKWGYGSIEVVNLFALCSTDPKALKQSDDPVGGPEADEAIVNVVRECPATLVAWGNHGLLNKRSAAVLQILQPWADRLMALEVTRKGQPKHPLYVWGETKPFRFCGQD